MSRESKKKKKKNLNYNVSIGDIYMMGLCDAYIGNAINFCEGGRYN